jgi:hypothetical protein
MRPPALASPLDSTAWADTTPGRAPTATTARHLPAVRLPAQPVPVVRRTTLTAVRLFTSLADGEFVDMRFCC